jgi:hypothetical protein
MAVTDRTVVVTVPISDGQAPVYNASQDKFLPTTVGGGAVVAGPSITTPPSATGTRSLVGGSSATDNGNQNAIILGTSANTQAGFSVVIGDSAAAGAGSSDVAIGFSASGSLSGGGSSVAVGVVATAGGTNSVAVGNGANCASTANSSVAIGNSAHSLGQFDIAVGNASHAGATTSQRPSVAFGSGAHADFDNSIALGTATVATAIGEMAFATINQGVSLINTSVRMNVMSAITILGTGTPTSLTLADGTTTTITLGATVSPMVVAPTPPGCITIEASVQGHDTVSGNTIQKAFWQRYAYNYTTGSFVAGTQDSAGDGVADFTITASVSSHNLSITFNSGTRSGNFTAVAFVRYI